MPREKISEMAKTAAIFCLAVILLVEMILVMAGQSAHEDEALPFENRMVVYESGAQSAFSGEMDPTRLTPTAVVWRGEGRNTRGITASDRLPDVYALLTPALRSFMGEEGLCTVYGQEDGNAVWEACLSMGAYIYVSYPGALPPAVLYAYAATEEDGASVSDATPAGDSIYVRELFLIPESEEENAPTVCITRDDRGRVARLLAGAEDAHTETVRAYIAMADALIPDAPSLTFYGTDRTLPAYGRYALSGDTALGTDTALYYSTALSLPALALSYPRAGEVLFHERSAPILTSLLSLMGLGGADMENHYTEPSGDRIYLYENGRLTLGDNGNLFYTAIGRGLPVSLYLGYTDVAGSYSLTEYLRAADGFLDRLRKILPAWVGGVATPTLTDVRLIRENEGYAVSITYSYTHMGLPLLDTDGTPMTALSMTVRDARILSLSLHALSAESGEDTVLAPHDVSLELMAYTDAGTETGPMPGDPVQYGIIRPVYLAEEDGGSCLPEWVFEAASLYGAESEHEAEERNASAGLPE